MGGRGASGGAKVPNMGANNAKAKVNDTVDKLRDDYGNIRVSYKDKPIEVGNSEIVKYTAKSGKTYTIRIDSRGDWEVSRTVSKAVKKSTGGYKEVREDRYYKPTKEMLEHIKKRAK